MKFYTIFIVFTFTPKLQSNTKYLQTIENLNKIIFKNAPKHWSRYLNRLLFNDLSKRKFNVETSINSIIFCLKQSTSGIERKSRILEVNLNVIKRREAALLLHKRGLFRDFHLIESNASMRRPAGLAAKSRTTADPLYDLPLAFNHQWIFRLNQQLRLNLSFNVFYLSVSACNAAFLDIVDSKQRTLHRYCGIKSYFLNFPLVNYVNMFFVVCSSFTYNVTFTFSVIDSQRIYSKTYFLDSIKYGIAIPSWIWFINEEEIHVEKYLLQVQKYWKITVQMPPPENVTNVHLEVYDGPGAMCKRLKQHKVRYVSSNIIFKASSFQCLIYKWFSEGSLHYLPQGRSAERLVVKHDMKLSLPDQMCTNSIACDILLVLDKKHSHLNVTTDTLLYSGTADNILCNFAGLAAYNVRGRNSYHLISSKCFSNDNVYTHQPIYSKSNSLLIIVYSYKEYGTLTVNISVSKTACRPVSLNLCKTKTVETKYLIRKPGSIEFKVPKGKCIVLQTTHKINSTICWMIQITSNNCSKTLRHAPKHEPGRIIDYKVTGFLSGVNRNLELIGDPQKFCITKKFSVNGTVYEKGRCGSCKRVDCKLSHPEAAQQIAISMQLSTASPDHRETPTFYLHLHNEFPRNWVDFVITHKSLVINSTTDEPLNKFVNELSRPLNNTYHVRKILLRNDYMILVHLSPIKHPKHNIKLKVDAVLSSFSDRVLGDRVETLYWGTIFRYKSHDLIPEKLPYLLSLPGVYTKIMFQNLGIITNYNIKIFWLTNTYKLSKTADDNKCNTNFQEVLPYSYCINFTLHSNRRHHYLYFRKYFVKSVFPLKKRAKFERSWLEASRLCNSARGYLPIIMSKLELHHLVTIIRMSPQIQPARYIFIGIVQKVLNQIYSWSNGDPVAFQPLSSTSKINTAQTYLHYKIKRDHNLQRDCSELRNAIDISNTPSVLEYLNCFQAKLSFYKPYLENTTLDYSSMFDRNESMVKCGLLFLTNLAFLNWTTVSCVKPIVSDIFCFVESSPLENLNVRVRFKGVDKSIVYEKTCVIKYNTCFKFQSKITNQEKSYLTHLNSTDLRQFQFLFDAVAVTFPPIFAKGVEGTMSAYHYSRYSNIYVYRRFESEVTDENVLFMLTHTLKDIFSRANVFQCSDGAFISLSHLCDENNDCLGDGRSDEIGCECVNDDDYSSKCKYIVSKSRDKQCSAFYMKTKEGTCKLYRDILFNSNININVIKKEHIGHQLPCNKVENNTFSASDICSFKLNTEKQMIKCKRGEHLQSCKDFECNSMLKCPNYYCIPWSYVCDGKWDCPGGYDESSYFNCGSNRSCSNMFRCRAYSVCVHLGDICNNEIDCPHGDDEHFCSLQKSACPSLCHCLTFVIKCYNISVDKYFSKARLPHYIVVIKKSIFTPLNAVGFYQVLSLSVTHNNLQQICLLISQMKLLRILDGSSNNIHHIDAACFAPTFLIQIIKLKENFLHRIMKNCFVHLKFLIYLDLSSNLLSQFSQSDLPKTYLHFLSLNNNSLSRITFQDFSALRVKIINTLDHRICCAVPEETKCPATKPWYMSCDYLLPKISIKVSFYLASFIIVAANCFSLLMSFENQQERSNSFKVTVISINIVDMSLGIYLVFLWAADLYYKNNFIFRYLQWRSETVCFAVFGLSVNFALMSPVMLSFLSLSRLMVVINPIKTAFKDSQVVMRVIAGLFLICSLMAAVTTILVRIINKDLPMSLCSPFIDPTGSVVMIKVLTWLIIGAQMLAVNFILFIYLSLVRHLKKSESVVHTTVNKYQDKKSLMIQLVIITGSNILCWIPTSVIYLLSMFMHQFPIDMVIWTTVAVTPINSVVNPVVFIATGGRKMLKTKLRKEIKGDSK